VCAGKRLAEIPDDEVGVLKAGWFKNLPLLSLQLGKPR